MGSTLWRNARLATLTGRSPWGLNSTEALSGEGRLFALDWTRIRPGSGLDIEVEHDLGGALVTPGLNPMGGHTHLSMPANAHPNSSSAPRRTYEQIAQAGGGDPIHGGRTRSASDEGAVFQCRGRRRSTAGRKASRRSRSSPATDWSWNTNGAACRWPGASARARRGRAHHLSGRTRVCRRSSRPRRRLHRRRVRAGCLNCTPVPGRCGGRVLRAYRVQPASRRSVFEQARRLGLPVKLMRQFMRLRGRGAGGELSCAVVVITWSTSAPRAWPRWRLPAARRPAAGCVPSCARPRVPPVDAMRRAGVPRNRTDPSRDLAHLSLRPDADMACTLFD